MPQLGPVKPFCFNLGCCELRGGAVQRWDWDLPMRTFSASRHEKRSEIQLLFVHRSCVLQLAEIIKLVMIKKEQPVLPIINFILAMPKHF